MEKLELLTKVRNGEIEPSKAIEVFEAPAARHIGDIPIDNLKVDVLDCGFPSLNEYMVFKRGRGELIVLGARPSMGKSAFLFQVGTHVAKRGNVYISSLEMDAESIKARMLASLSGYGLNDIMKGKVPNERLTAANNELSKLHYYIDDRSGLDIGTLMSSIIDFNKKSALALVVVDYLQLVKSGNRASRNEEVGDISNELKRLAKIIKCPVLAASQLNRKCVERGQAALAQKKTPDYRPEMGDLRESGNIEQDADGIIFLSRHEALAPGFRVGQADVGIAKQRNGPCGWITMKWHGASTRFEDPQRDQL